MVDRFCAQRLFLVVLVVYRGYGGGTLRFYCLCDDVA